MKNIVFCFLFYSVNIFSQSISHEVVLKEDSVYLYYDIILNNESEQILVFYGNPGYSLNANEYEEVENVYGNIVFDYFIEEYKRIFNLIIMPKQSLVFRLKTKKKKEMPQNLKLLMMYKFLSKIYMNLLKEKPIKNDDFKAFSPVGYKQPKGFSNYIIKLPTK